MVDFLTPILLSLIAGAATGIGGLIGVYKSLSMKYFDMAIGFAAGVMLAVATLGLINQGIILLNGGYTAFIIAITIIAGVALGMIVLLIIDRILPHLHTLDDAADRKEDCKRVVCAQECKCPNKDKWFECPYLEDGICKSAGNCYCPRRLEFQKQIKYSGILLAIGLTIHNAPEGIAVGVGFLATAALGFSMALAIALHNIPEGLAIAMPLMQAKYKRKKILLIAFFSGMTEPIACLIAVFLLQNVSTIFLAFFLAFAGGAMIYITSDELIPESHKHGYEHQATIGLLLGFILMLLLIIVFQV
jgi:ZIP family zinc transporter